MSVRSETMLQVILFNFLDWHSYAADTHTHTQLSNSTRLWKRIVMHHRSVSKHDFALKKSSHFHPDRQTDRQLEVVFSFRLLFLLLLLRAECVCELRRRRRRRSCRRETWKTTGQRDVVLWVHWQSPYTSFLSCLSIYQPTDNIYLHTELYEGDAVVRTSVVCNRSRRPRTNKKRSPNQDDMTWALFSCHSLTDSTSLCLSVSLLLLLLLSFFYWERKALAVNFAPLSFLFFTPAQPRHFGCTSMIDTIQTSSGSIKCSLNIWAWSVSRNSIAVAVDYVSCRSTCLCRTGRKKTFKSINWPRIKKKTKRTSTTRSRMITKK